jgi:hypothetical protein
MICIPKNIAHIEAGTYDLADHPFLGHSRKLAAEMARCEGLDQGSTGTCHLWVLEQAPAFLCPLLASLA